MEQYGTIAHLDAYDERNNLDTVLDATASYLAEGAFGVYRLTTSRHTERVIAAIALITVASAYTPIPAPITAATNDVIAARIITLASGIQPRPSTLTLNPDVPGTPVRVEIPQRDALTAQMATAALAPPRPTRDAASIQQRIIEATTIHRGEFSHCHTPRGIIKRLGDLAGGTWPQVAVYVMNAGNTGKAVR